MAAGGGEVENPATDLPCLAEQRCAKTIFPPLCRASQYGATGILRYFVTLSYDDVVF